MDRILKPDRFTCDPNEGEATQKFNHWFKTFQNFITSCDQIQDDEKLKVLVNKQ